MRAIWVAILLAGRTAHADRVDDLVSRGEALAQDHDYTRAIDAFKQADQLRQRATHACMIGLAYMRRELWPQAELFLALCEKRAVPGDQPPAWIDEAEHQLAAKLSAAGIPAITIAVVPSNADARLTVSSFAPDEQFAPQTIHLAPGKHVIEVTASGFRPARQEIEVRPAEPQAITFTLEPEPGTVVLAPHVRLSRDEPPSLAPWLLLGSGVVLGGIAAGYGIAELGPAHTRLEQAQTRVAYDALEDDFSTTRWVTIGLAGAAAVAIATGLLLHPRLSRHAPAVTAQLSDRGAAIGLAWSR